MAGIGEAGLLFSLIPLLVSTAEHYGDIIRPFHRWRNVSAEVRRFQQRLMVQKAIYETECHLLLWSVTNREEAIAVLNNRGDMLGNTQWITTALEHRFGRSAEAYLAVVEQIQIILNQIDVESQELEHMVDSHKNKKVREQYTRELSPFSNLMQSGPAEETPQARTRLGKKLKFSLSGSRLDGVIKSLETLNRDLHTISAQVTKIAEREVDNTATRQNTRDLADHRNIKAASEALYRALQKACTKHTKHTACISLSKGQPRKTQIRFNVSFAHSALSTAKDSEDRACFKVDFVAPEGQTSIPGPSSPRCDDVSVNLTTTSKRQSTPPIPYTPKRSRVDTSSNFSLPTPPSSHSLGSPKRLSPGTPSDGSIPQLYVRSNFCDRIRHSLELNSLRLNSPLGLLDRCDNWKLVVYPPSKSARQRKTSLAELISLLSQDTSQLKLPKCERLRIARLLATAVLHFHKTPWLQDSWQSGDVMFFGIEDILQHKHEPRRNHRRVAERDDPPVPYLNSQVVVSDNERRPPHPLLTRSLAPCQTLFRLGVMMLELAHKAPLRTLQQPCDFEDGNEARYSEFFAARRLGELIDSSMGGTYGKIVRQCLQCDFGRGSDFGDPKLQAVFHEEVICELQKLEVGFRNLQLGA